MRTLPEGCCDPRNPVEIGTVAANEIAAILGLLADPIRLRILSMVASGDEVCACHLETLLSKSQPTISHHLSRLSAAGIIIGERRGRWMYWRLAPRFSNVAPTILGLNAVPLPAN